jgi:hypothetical protein
MSLKGTTLLSPGGSPGALTSIPTWLPAFTFDYTDFAVADVQEDILLYSLQAGGHVDDAMIKHTTAFAGPGILTVEASAGIVGSLERIIPLFDVLQAVGNGTGQPVNIQDWYDQAVATALRVQLVSTGANLNVLTQGAFSIWLKLSKAA